MAAPLPPTFSNRSLRVLSGNEDDLRAAAAAAEAANEAAEENGGAGGSQEAGTTASLTEGAAPPRRVGFVGVPDPEPAAERSDLDDDICELCLERGHSKEECKFYVQRRRARSKSLAACASTRWPRSRAAATGSGRRAARSATNARRWATGRRTARRTPTTPASGRS